MPQLQQRNIINSQWIIITTLQLWSSCIYSYRMNVTIASYEVLSHLTPKPCEIMVFMATKKYLIFVVFLPLRSDNRHIFCVKTQWLAIWKRRATGSEFRPHARSGNMLSPVISTYHPKTRWCGFTVKYIQV